MVVWRSRGVSDALARADREIFSPIIVVSNVLKFNTTGWNNFYALCVLAVCVCVCVWDYALIAIVC